MTLVSCACSQSKDAVDEYDRLDLANTVDTTKASYNPPFDSTYFFPKDSSDIVSTAQHSHYKIETIVFPVARKYIVGYVKDEHGTSKVLCRDYKVQVKITNEEGLLIKKVITKYDFPESIIGSKPRYDFIREAKFKEFKDDEFRIDIQVSRLLQKSR